MDADQKDFIGLVAKDNLSVFRQKITTKAALDELWNTKMSKMHVRVEIFEFPLLIHCELNIREYISVENVTSRDCCLHHENASYWKTTINFFTLHLQSWHQSIEIINISQRFVLDDLQPSNQRVYSTSADCYHICQYHINLQRVRFFVPNKMKLVRDNVVEITERMDRNTLVFIIDKQDNFKLCVVEFGDEISIKLTELLKRHNMYPKKFKLYEDIPLNCVDYILEIEDDINEELENGKGEEGAVKVNEKCNKKSNVNSNESVGDGNFETLFVFGNKHFFVSDYMSLGENQELTSGVIDATISQLFLRNVTFQGVVPDSFLMPSAITLLEKLNANPALEDNSPFHKRLDDSLRELNMHTCSRILIPFCQQHHWILLEVRKSAYYPKGSFLYTGNVYDSAYVSPTSFPFLGISLIQEALQLVFKRAYMVANITPPAIYVDVFSKPCPMQAPGSNDCGVFMLKNVQNILLQRDIFLFNSTRALVARKGLAKILLKLVDKEVLHLVPEIF